jgi:glycosyltransferase involved in cell wall biosynthesis
MNPLRILVLAADANPESISTSLVGYSHAEALARRHQVTIVIRDRYEAAVRRKGSMFREIVAVRVPGFDEFSDWAFKNIFKSNYASQAGTGFDYPFMLAFEWCVWRRLRARIRAGEFDVVLRVLPVTTVLPGAFGYFLRKGPIPFVIGPINGGLPWPKGFAQAERQREWVSGLRDLYRLLPFGRSTYRGATAIIAGSSHTASEFPEYRDKVFFVPENGIKLEQIATVHRPPRHGEKLQLMYVGRLVPYKACDLALKACAPLLQAGRAHLTIVGDGPERPAIEEMTRTLKVTDSVTFTGWLSHAETLEHMQRGDVLVFPSIREFGGGNVFEALAMGMVPIVVAFGGPGDIVNSRVGYSVPLTTPDDIVRQMAAALAELDGDPDLLTRLREEGMRYAREQLTWEGKAETVTRVLTWAVGQGPKPELPPPHLTPVMSQPQSR